CARCRAAPGFAPCSTPPHAPRPLWRPYPSSSCGTCPAPGRAARRRIGPSPGALWWVPPPCSLSPVSYIQHRPGLPSHREIIDKSSKSHRTSHLTAAYSSATTLTRRSASHPLETKYTMLQPPVQGPPFSSERALVVQ